MSDNKSATTIIFPLEENQIIGTKKAHTIEEKNSGGSK